MKILRIEFYGFVILRDLEVMLVLVVLGSFGWFGDMMGLRVLLIFWP